MAEEIVIDFLNWQTMIIELFIAGIVATWFFWRQKQQSDKIKKLVTEISTIGEKQQKIIGEQYEFLKSEKQRVERWKSKWGTVLLANVESINRMYEILEEWLNEYKQNPSAQLKLNIINSALRNGEIVKFDIQSLQEYLPYIETQFEDPTLSLNLKSISKHALTVFQSLHMDHHWESNLEGTFALINDKKRILSQLIERLKKEIPKVPQQ